MKIIAHKEKETGWKIVFSFSKVHLTENNRTYQPGGIQLASPRVILSLGSCVLYPNLSCKSLEFRRLPLLPGWLWLLKCWPRFIEFDRIKLIRAWLCRGIHCSDSVLLSCFPGLICISVLLYVTQSDLWEDLCNIYHICCNVTGNLVIKTV